MIIKNAVITLSDWVLDGDKREVNNEIVTLAEFAFIDVCDHLHLTLRSIADAAYGMGGCSETPEEIFYYDNNNAAIIYEPGKATLARLDKNKIYLTWIQNSLNNPYIDTFWEFDYITQNFKNHFLNKYIDKVTFTHDVI